MSLRKLALLVCLLLPFAVSGCAGETPTEHAANVYAANELAAAPLHGNLPDYSLPPAQLHTAQGLFPLRAGTQVVALIWSVLLFVVLLWSGLAAGLRNRALAASAKLRAAGKERRAFWRELLVFTALYTLITSLLILPIAIFRHVVAVHYGLSVQGWASWSRDYFISFVILLCTTGFIFATLKALLQKYPTKWWFYSWLIAIPMTVFFVFAGPYVIDPLFNNFEPLQKTEPALVARLQQVVARGHMDIPPERMYLMKASAKVTTMNAYVTGFGSSKRVVVWDTSLSKGTSDEVLFIFGHESGHYVLGHIREGIVLGLLGLLLGLFLASRFLPWSLRLFGGRWRIPSQNDWAALVVLAFFLELAGLVADPLASALVRSREHNADVYGQEAIHGIVEDPQRSAQHAFEVLAASSFEEPNVPQWQIILFSDHPSTGRRAAFAHAYNPWAPGAEPKYFPKEPDAAH